MRRSILAAVVFAVLTCAGEGWAQTWKPFQELGFLTGSWSGCRGVRGRIAGVTASWGMEMNGNFLMHTTNVVLPASEGKTEESIRIVGYYSVRPRPPEVRGLLLLLHRHPGHVRRHLAADGSSVKLLSTQLLNYEAGARARISITKAAAPAADITFQLDLAASGKDFVPFVIAKLAKR